MNLHSGTSSSYCHLTSVQILLAKYMNVYGETSSFNLHFVEKSTIEKSQLLDCRFLQQKQRGKKPTINKYGKINSVKSQRTIEKSQLLDCRFLQQKQRGKKPTINKYGKSQRLVNSVKSQRLVDG
jgi:hypothetical protein